MKGRKMEDRKTEEWARLILEEATRLVELLGESQDSRHLLRPGRDGILTDQWTQPPLIGTEDIATDPRRLALREEVQSLEPRLHQAYILVAGMVNGLERAHERWKGDH